MRFKLASIAIFFILFTVNVINCLEFFKFLNAPNYDGLSRAKKLTLNEETKNELSNLITELNVNSKGLLLVIESDSLNGQKKRGEKIEQFVELSAQLLEKRNVSVYRISIPKDASQVPAELAHFKCGDIYLYYAGKKYQYFGRRDALSLLSFVLKLNENRQIKEINGKLDKIAYDTIQSPKVVGFFMQGTADYNEFVAAAALFSPSIPFFVVTDRTKLPIACPQNPATAANIESFVNQNRGIVLTHLNEHNLHDPSILNTDKHLILAIGEQNSPIGGYFHRLITKLIRNVTTIETPKSETGSKTQKSKIKVKVATVDQKVDTVLENVSIVWVDLQSFPTLYLMMDQLERVLNFPPGLSFHLGAVNVTSNQSVWFDTSSLNITADKGADEANIAALKQWIDDIVASRIKPAKIGVQSFSVKPSNTIVNEGDNFVLQCLVENQVGDCLWLKDGQNIGFNLNRYGNHYAWKAAKANGDCSLLVNGAEFEMDDGNWACEVTGDQTNPTITSPPAKITVNKNTVKVEF
ncbi:Calsequestrin-2-like protein [Leptotrombidium deliense]|uniref:Calsequestrin n=1 Tax=Leptotrombidium deliense TaxID=299467 RepID=A0A443SMU9_9ACAR|nr:Calsequestrin-2-like protein [Leptotrombidium deliense]